MTKQKPGYPVENITIPVAGILSEGDEACSAGPNQLILEAVPGFTSTIYSDEAADHIGMIADNSAFTITSLKEYLSDIAIVVENELLCPIEPIPDPDEQGGGDE